MHSKSDIMKANQGYIVPLALMVILAIGLAVTGEYLGSPPAVEQSTTLEELAPGEALLLIHGNPDFIILDVRTPEEFATGHIAGAVNLDYHSENFNEAVNLLNKNKSYLVYCQKGTRSGYTIDMMAVLHFGEVFNMLGGIEAWQAAGLPVFR
jgi:rhodanese-related sulfurtransferase